MEGSAGDPAGGSTGTSTGTSRCVRARSTPTSTRIPTSPRRVRQTMSGTPGSLTVNFAWSALGREVRKRTSTSQAPVSGGTNSVLHPTASLFRARVT
ncbi:hypothetical protein D7Y13_40065 [Corallococcus praedator]|uniref:Uncharacterized protein n=1 Tax=Corallococcus praedator TaxID=2316724 RepID=A0ABX9Q480_9BACT|nr:hypothetical protein D7X75_37375 [Corallococcus sp. CA031C]RKH90152.1 hypothetical protein D7Y13_40065 [Corallococcus praedator]